MNSMNDAPTQMHSWLASLPDKYCGTLYATIKTPFLPIYTEHKVPVWGQVADGRPHMQAVHQMLYNKLPLHGKGFTYVSWRSVPDHPETHDRPTQGTISSPKPFSGTWGDDSKWVTGEGYYE